MSEFLQNIIAVGGISSAVSAVTVLVIKAYKVIKQRDDDHRDLMNMKEENTLICFALSACLDGLEQLGANHTVPKAKDKLDKYLNRQAHK